MTSSYLTFDFLYDLNIQCIQSLGTGHAHVQRITMQFLQQLTHNCLYTHTHGETSY